MRKQIILITILLACIPVLIVIYRVNDYYSYKYYNEKRIWMNSHDIKDIDVSINNKEKDIEQEKNDNNMKIDILKLWKKRLEKIS